MPRGFLLKRHLDDTAAAAGPQLLHLPPLQLPHLDDRRTPPTMTALEDFAYHYSPAMFHGLYRPLARAPHMPLSLGDWAVVADVGVGVGLGLPQHSAFSDPLSLISTPPPLDLSLKAHPATPITPPSTPSPASPSRKRHHSEESEVTPVKVDFSNNNDESATNHNTSCSKDGFHSASKRPVSKVPAKKTKAVRKLNFDEDKSSPVSGTIIRDIDDVEADSMIVRKGDIDPAFNVVEVTEEAKAELASIENKIGDYVCRLCRELYDDAFSLAQHRCSCIVHVEYRCPECDKVFNCPANLASHRRWHKPKVPPGDARPKEGAVMSAAATSDSEGDLNAAGHPHIPCPVCQKRFRRQAYLRKHLLTHSNQLLLSPTAGAGVGVGAVSIPSPGPSPGAQTITTLHPDLDLDLPPAN